MKETPHCISLCKATTWKSLIDLSLQEQGRIFEIIMGKLHGNVLAKEENLFQFDELIKNSKILATLDIHRKCFCKYPHVRRCIEQNVFNFLIPSFCCLLIKQPPVYIYYLCFINPKLPFSPMYLRGASRKIRTYHQSR